MKARPSNRRGSVASTSRATMTRAAVAFRIELIILWKSNYIGKTGKRKGGYNGGKIGFNHKQTSTGPVNISNNFINNIATWWSVFPPCVPL